MYAIDSKCSFENISHWLEDLKSQANPDIRIFLVGNKSDLEETRQVPEDDAKGYAELKKIDLFFETSAKTGFNAKNVLIEAAKMLYGDYLKYKQTSRVGSLSSNDGGNSNSSGKQGKPLEKTGTKLGSINTAIPEKFNLKCCKT